MYKKKRATTQKKHMYTQQYLFSAAEIIKGKKQICTW